MIVSNVKLLYQEFKNLHDSRILNHQVKVDFEGSSTDITKVNIFVAPSSGVFRGASIPFLLMFPEDYPQNPPKVKCLVKLYHPNISLDGEVCFSMLKEGWNSNYRLEQFIIGLLWLIDNPNSLSPLNPACAIRDEFQYQINARLGIQGLEIDGVTYTKLIKLEDELYATLSLLFRGMTSTRQTYWVVPLSSYNIPTSVLHQDHWFRQVFDPKLGFEALKLRQIDTDTVEKRAKALVVPLKSCLREQLFQLGSRMILTIGKGTDMVTKEQLAQYYGVSVDTCVEATKEQLEAIDCHSTISILELCGRVNEILMNSKIKSEAVFISAGFPRFLLRMRSAALKKLISKYKLTLLDFTLFQRPPSPTLHEKNFLLKKQDYY